MAKKNPKEVLGKVKKVKFVTEFKEFISKGNVLDMAVGMIVGAAFTAIVTSLVNNILMPALGMITGGVDFKDLKIVLKEAVTTVADGVETIVEPEVAIGYGVFINSIISFLFVALAVFILIKVVGMFKHKKKEEPKPDPAPDPQIVLLTEIRDLLKGETDEEETEEKSEEEVKEPVAENV